MQSNALEILVRIASQNCLISRDVSMLGIIVFTKTALILRKYFLKTGTYLLVYVYVFHRFWKHFKEH